MTSAFTHKSVPQKAKSICSGPHGLTQEGISDGLFREASLDGLSHRSIGISCSPVSDQLDLSLETQLAIFGVRLEGPRLSDGLCVTGAQDLPG